MLRKLHSSPHAGTCSPKMPLGSRAGQGEENGGKRFWKNMDVSKKQHRISITGKVRIFRTFLHGSHGSVVSPPSSRRDRGVNGSLCWSLCREHPLLPGGAGKASPTTTSRCHLEEAGIPFPLLPRLISVLLNRKLSPLGTGLHVSGCGQGQQVTRCLSKQVTTLHAAPRRGRGLPPWPALWLWGNLTPSTPDTTRRQETETQEGKLVFAGREASAQ